MSTQLVFVWRHYRPDHTDGLAVVVASNRREAVQTLLAKEREEGTPYPGSDWGECEVFELGAPLAFLCDGGA